jgi:hypothetical protein
MTWANRFKLLFGLVAVVGIVAVLTLVFNQRQAQVMSASASGCSASGTPSADATACRV